MGFLRRRTARRVEPAAAVLGADARLLFRVVAEDRHVRETKGRHLFQELERNKVSAEAPSSAPSVPVTDPDTTPPVVSAAAVAPAAAHAAVVDRVVSLAPLRLPRMRLPRRMGIAVPAAVIALVVVGTVIAFWTTTGTGDATASVGKLDAASISVPETSTGSVTVTWDSPATMMPSSQNSAVTYTVERKLDAGSFAAVGSGLCSGPLLYATATCIDTVGVSGTYTYRVVAHFSTSWTATSNEDSVVVTIDNTPPEVDSITRLDVSPTSASEVSWTVTFSEDVTGVDATDFDLVGTGSGGAAITDVSGSGDTYTVTADTGDDGVLGLNLVDDDSIQDLAANELGGTGPIGAGDGSFTGETYDVDRTAPDVYSIERVDPSPTNAGTVAWTVTFTEDVTDVDAADFALTTTGLSGSPALETVTPIDAKTYTVTASTGTATPSGVGTIRLDVTDDDSIEDSVANPLGGTGTGNGDFTTGETYTIDKTQPTVTSINRKSGAVNPTNVGPLEFTVTFSEPVSNVVAGNFVAASSNVTGSPVVGATVATGGAPSATWTVALNMTGVTGANNGLVGLDLNSGGTIQDVATNLLAAIHASDQVFTYDTTQPTVTSINRKSGAVNPTNVGPLEFTVTFSEPVNNVVAGNFSLTHANLGGTAPSVGVPTAVGGAPATEWTVPVSTVGTTGANNGSIRLDLSSVGTIRDAATNLLSTTRIGDQAFTYDTTQPTVTSINRKSGAVNPTNVGPLEFTVTFSEPVNNVVAGNFSLTHANLGGTAPSVGVPTAVGGAPATEWTVPVSTVGTTGANNGSIRLDLSSVGTIRDAATNLLSTTRIGDQAFTYDTTQPTVTVNQKAGQNDPTNTLPILYTVTFSESVTGFDATDLTRSGSATGGTVGVTGGGASYEISVTGSPTNGTITFTVGANRAVDTAGNNNLASTSTDNTVTYDTVGPTRTAIEMFDVDGNGKIDRVVVTFNDTLVSSTATSPPWTLANVPSGGTLASVATAANDATLTLNEGAGAANTAVGSFTVSLAATATGIRDAAGNQSSFAAVAPVDKAAPARTLMEMFDANTNAKVDRVDVTFSEALATYSAGTTPWTLANVPSNGSLSGVTIVTTTMARLTLTEGGGAADTAVGSFTIALGTNATGVRDATGNVSSFAAQAPADAAGPVAVSITDTNGTTDGLIQSGDSLIVTFSEAIASAVGPATIIVETDPPGGGANDTLSISGLTNGPRDTGSNNYVNNNNRSFQYSSSTLAKSNANKTLTATVAGTCTGDCSDAATNGTAANFNFAPDPGLADAAGNAATGSLIVSIRLF